MKVRVHGSDGAILEEWDNGRPLPPTPPPWNASDQEMPDWSLACLDEMEAAIADVDMSLPPDQRFKPFDMCQLMEPGSEAWAIAEAKRGNMDPLRKLYPQLAEFLCPPRLKRGQHFKPVQWDKNARIRMARFDAYRIKVIWKGIYGRCHRSKGLITAEKIAAERWGISVKALKRGPRKRSRRPRQGEEH